MRASLIPIILAFVLAAQSVFSFPHPQEISDKQSPEQLKKLVDVTTRLEINLQLRQYVRKLFRDYGEDQLPRERFLVSLMWLMNRELSRRLENPKKARKEYFEDLHNMLQEIEQLRSRLKQAKITELDRFVDDLQQKIKITIENREIDFRKRSVFEDALQLLYVAEEMIKLDQLQTRAPEITRKISQSKEKLLTAFGEISPAAGPLEKIPSLYDLFSEWKKTDQIKYSLRLADVKLVRQNLLKSSGLDGILRMFNQELRLAYQNFNLGNFDLADRLFEDIAETYPAWQVKNLDDMYFYWGEANFALNRYNRARELFEELLRQYPSTPYISDVYARLVQINYDFKNYPRVIEYGNLYRNVASPQKSEYAEIQFLIGMAYYENRNYDLAVETFMDIPTSHPYHAIAQYFAGNAYAAAQLYDEARNLYTGLLNSVDTPPEIYARSAYKLAIIEYENKNYLGAIDYLNKIPSNFSRYDKVLNALAWSYFEYERSKPAGESRNFYFAEYYARQLVDRYYASPFTMEAKSLLAFINQMEDEPVKAIDLYREVYQTKASKNEVDEYIQERQKLNQLYAQAKEYQERALIEKNPQAYTKASRLVNTLEDEIQKLQLSESAGVGSTLYKEVGELISQLNDLRALKKEAIEQENKEALKRVDSLMVRLTSVLEGFPVEIIRQAQNYNLFDEFPVTKWIAEKNNQYRSLTDNRQIIAQDFSKLDGEIQDLQQQIMFARQNNDFATVIRLEQKLDELKEIKKRYDRLFSLTYKIPAVENPYPEFSRWGDLGAFGIINVHFDQKNKIESLNRRIAESLDVVNEEITKRKTEIENKIKKIEAEIRFMTMRARMEERLRLRAERERRFKESYFDTRRSEVESDEKE